MAKNSKTKSAKQRVKIQSLPTKAKTLTAKEAKKVKGGQMRTQIKTLPGEPPPTSAS